MTDGQRSVADDFPLDVDVAIVAHNNLAVLPATLASHLGLRELADMHVDLGSAPGRAHVGDKLFALVASALTGGNCIADADALRAGGTAAVLDQRVPAPSTLGTFLRGFGWDDPIDLGDITASRGTEMMLPVWLRLMVALKTPMFNFHIAR